jgi:uncharacterized protein with von Willebrand factor type A (vWA) domain
MMKGKKPGTFRVGLLLDESGSMAGRKDETIQAVNTYFDSLKGHKAHVTFATFDSGQGVRFRQTDVLAEKITPLTAKTYVPNAYTPLLDAVGKLIQMMTGQAGDKDKVVVVVVTDGAENASKEFNLIQVRELIASLQEKQWAFAFIGAAPEAWAGGVELGTPVANLMNISGARGSMKGAMRVTSLATVGYAKGLTEATNFYDMVQEDEIDGEE